MQESRTLSAGDVISVLFPEHLPSGREQQGFRPAVIVGKPERLEEPRFEIVIVVPLTTDREQEWAKHSPALYPRLARGVARLHSPSICLLDQIRAIGAERVRGYRGTLDAEQYRPIHAGLLKILSHPKS